MINKGRINIASIKVTSAGGEPAAGMPISIIVRIENSGRGTVNAIESELSCGGQKAKAFLGQLKRDEDAPAVFEMQLSSGRNECAMTTNYSDDLGGHSVTNKLDISVKNPEFPVAGVLIVIVILGLVYYFIIRKRRNKPE